MALQPLQTTIDTSLSWCSLEACFSCNCNWPATQLQGDLPVLGNNRSSERHRKTHCRRSKIKDRSSNNSCVMIWWQNHSFGQTDTNLLNQLRLGQLPHSALHFSKSNQHTNTPLTSNLHHLTASLETNCSSNFSRIH